VAAPAVTVGIKAESGGAAAPADRRADRPIEAVGLPRP
jgi:hypothetical protein